MSEIEVKFQVPDAAREGLRLAVATASARSVRLRASYADTADGRLAAAGFALRLREEDARRVQTLKGRGAGLIERFEHEVELAPGTGPASIDPARHAGTPGGEALGALLADGAPLVEGYRTEIQRLTRRVRSGGATIELALDEGRITAAGRVLAVFEIEFELVAGAPAALVAFAARWAERHGLWLDIRTKSERGQRLALGLERVAPVKASALAWPSPATPAAVCAAALQSALAQVLPNAAEVAGASAEAEHLHQLRVGLRRLRTALRLFGPWSGDPPAVRDLEQAWREP
ncbi:MAG: CYTH domain-containing protein, partial [Burkholderiales bacterium]|nr:CYTH domain-containing protein [Burkholderiales bacterium]